MAYDLQEQEQIDALKAWWRRYGTLVVVAAVVSVVAVAAFEGWRYYRERQALAAVTLYGELDRAEQAGDAKKVRELAAEIVSRYGSTPYATFAALAAARTSFDAGDLEEAKARLRWVVERAREDEVRAIARIRLAGVLLDEKRYDEALQVLGEKPPEALVALHADRRGDILAAQGKKEEARAAYRLALDRSDAGSEFRETVRLKLEALGEPERGEGPPK
jgi:predicted negative regulator of RcsB-dependent stress response